MRNITLIYSGHRDRGLCNAEELLKLLQSIGPEVIFEEMRPADFDSYYKHGTKRSLESRAIAGYGRLKSFRQVQVDRYDVPEESLFAESQRVFGYLEQSSQEYNDLMDANDKGTYKNGFRHLNSVACAAMMARISEIEEKMVAQSRDQDLIRGLEKWRHAIQSREREMVGNIYKFCRESTFDIGVFLIGAAHGAGIAKEIEKYASTEEV